MSEHLNLHEMWREELMKEAQVRPVHTNRASQIGHPCARYLVFDRTRWQEKNIPSADLMAIFNLGNEVEDIVLRILKRLGFRIIEQQRSVFWKELNLSGHIEGRYIFPSWEAPRLFEIKSMSQFTYDVIDNVDDMVNSDKSWIRKYPAQSLAYLLLMNEPVQDFIPFNKQTGQIKNIPIVLNDHLALAESYLQRVEQVNKHVEDGTTPDRILDNMGGPADDCEGCDYELICLPGGSFGAAMTQLDDAQLAKLLDAHGALDQSYDDAKKTTKKRDALRVKIKAAVTGKEKILVGDWIVTGSWTKGDKPRWNWKVKRVGEKL